MLFFLWSIELIIFYDHNYKSHKKNKLSRVKNDGNEINFLKCRDASSDLFKTVFCMKKYI